MNLEKYTYYFELNNLVIESQLWTICTCLNIPTSILQNNRGQRCTKSSSGLRSSVCRGGAGFETITLVSEEDPLSFLPGLPVPTPVQIMLPKCNDRPNVLNRRHSSLGTYSLDVRLVSWWLVALPHKSNLLRKCFC